MGVAVISILGLIIFWLFFLNKEDAIPEELEISGTEIREQRVDIDFKLLESELIKQLKPFEFILSTSTENFGRDNPFTPNTELSTTTPDL